jgi:hypothetical protein
VFHFGQWFLPDADGRVLVRTCRGGDVAVLPVENTGQYVPRIGSKRRCRTTVPGKTTICSRCSRFLDLLIECS